MSHKTGLSAFAALFVAVTILSGAAASAQNFLSPTPMAPHKMRAPAKAPAAAAPAQMPSSSQMPSSGNNANVQPAAVAAPDLQQIIGDWKLTCDKAPVRRCVIAQRRVDPKSQAVLIWAELSKSGAGPASDYQLSIMVPLGLKIQGFRMQTSDRKDIANLPIYACVPAGCIYEAVVQDPTLQKIFDQRAVTAPFYTLSGQEMDLGLTTNGLKDALMKMTLYLRT
jgi:invasion protein IalB